MAVKAGELRTAADVLLYEIDRLKAEGGLV